MLEDQMKTQKSNSNDVDNLLTPCNGWLKIVLILT